MIELVSVECAEVVVDFTAEGDRSAAGKDEGRVRNLPAVKDASIFGDLWKAGDDTLCETSQCFIALSRGCGRVVAGSEEFLGGCLCVSNGFLEPGAGGFQPVGEDWLRHCGWWVW